MNRMHMMGFALATLALSASADNTVLLSDYDDAPRRKQKPQGVRIDDPRHFRNPRGHPMTATPNTAALEALLMKVEADGYEVRCYKVVWSFKVGTIGDSEGRTWAKDLISQADFPTKEAAELHRKYHPDIFLDQWGQWRTKQSYGVCGIFREERLIAAPVAENDGGV